MIRVGGIGSCGNKGWMNRILRVHAHTHVRTNYSTKNKHRGFRWRGEARARDKPSRNHRHVPGVDAATSLQPRSVGRCYDEDLATGAVDDASTVRRCRAAAAAAAAQRRHTDGPTTSAVTAAESVVQLRACTARLMGHARTVELFLLVVSSAASRSG